LGICVNKENIWYPLNLGVPRDALQSALSCESPHNTIPPIQPKDHWKTLIVARTIGLLVIYSWDLKLSVLKSHTCWHCWCDLEKDHGEIYLRLLRSMGVVAKHCDDTMKALTGLVV